MRLSPLVAGFAILFACRSADKQSEVTFSTLGNAEFTMESSCISGGPTKAAKSISVRLPIGKLCPISMTSKGSRMKFFHYSAATPSEHLVVSLGMLDIIDTMNGDYEFVEKAVKLDCFESAAKVVSLVAINDADDSVSTAEKMADGNFVFKRIHMGRTKVIATMQNGYRLPTYLFVGGSTTPITVGCPYP